MATFTPDGAVELYYDAVKKFETTSNGITVTGAQNKFQTSGEVSLMIGSTDAGGAAIYFDGDSNGDWIGGDYSWIGIRLVEIWRYVLIILLRMLVYI